MRPSRRKRLLSLLAAACALLAAATALAGGPFDHTYTGVDEWGDNVGGLGTAVMKVACDDGGVSKVYCVDADTYVVDGGRYQRSNIGDAAYFGPEAAARIRAIVCRTYPFVTLEALVSASGIESLSAAEAITGTQMAIWTLSNGRALTSENANVTALLSYLLALPPQEPASVPVGTISIVGSAALHNGAGTASFRYGTTARNADGSPVSLSHGFTEALPEGVTVNASPQADGTTLVELANLPADASPTFYVEGEQTVAFDAYFYSPQGGAAASQSLVGAYSGSTRIYAEAPLRYEDPGEYSLRILKYDSKTKDGIQGAVFQLSDNAQFSDPKLYEKATDENGYAEFTGLTEGSWHLREKSAPAGYIPDTNVYEIGVDAEPNDVIKFKNTHYAEIRILKVDDAEHPVAGARFSIYAGDKAEGTPVFSDLVTDENGVILQGSVEPGTYTVVETEAPVGYHLSPEPTRVVTLEPHESETVTMVNPLVKRGKIGVVKQDYVTGTQLNGAVIGLFSDETCQTELGRVTTPESGELFFENLLPGVYYVKELEAPEDYIINPAQEVVRVALEEDVIEHVVFRNRKQIDTAGNYGLLLLIGGGAVLVTGLAALLLRKKLVRGR